jgi:hypothetical protein
MALLWFTSWPHKLHVLVQAICGKLSSTTLHVTNDYK